MENKLKILYINNRPEPDGCAMYRNIIPAEGLQSLGWDPHFLPIPENDPFDYDIVVFSRIYQLSGIKPIVEMLRKKSKAKIVYDTDDLIDHIAPDNPFQSEINKKELVGSYLYFLDNADLVTVTTDYLKQEIAKRRSGAIAVVPNAVREIKIRDRREPRVRVLYSGSDTHFPDLNIFLDVFLDLQKKYDIELVTQSIGKNKYFEQNYAHLPMVMKPYNECMEKIKKVKHYQFVKNVHCFEYVDMLRSIDATIGVCPLHDDKFTRCKSAIKYYDWAAIGTVTLAQKCVAYEDCNFTARSYSDWKNKLECLITDIPLRNSILKSQIKYVIENRYIDVVRYQWDQVYRDLLAGKI